MNRTFIIGAIVVLLAAGGYYQFSFKPAQEAAMAVEAAKKAEEAAAAEAAAAEAAAAEAAAAATAAAEAAAAEAAAAATAAATAALDPAAFNADSVVALIDGSSLDDAMKTTLKTAVEAARANPALVADTIAQVKTALGM
ncbi:MAG: hypothetical protein NTW20_10390 [Rhodobacterales bacterium]|nr:hypothetical protein [Rhodobacterales bacterium]